MMMIVSTRSGFLILPNLQGYYFYVHYAWCTTGVAIGFEQESPSSRQSMHLILYIAILVVLSNFSDMTSFTQRWNTKQAADSNPYLTQVIQGVESSNDIICQG